FLGITPTQSPILLLRGAQRILKAYFVYFTYFAPISCTGDGPKNTHKKHQKRESCLKFLFSADRFNPALKGRLWTACFDNTVQIILAQCTV
uniref:Uncharacterized protein n=1 Tax=Anser brachyrhynchus TaxID=132585 RepID=A0A8B9I2M6_9AVES